MGEIKVCQGARYFSWGFNSFLNMSRPVWDKMACIRKMGALLIYMDANLCILHQGISKYKKLRMQIFGEWLSICSNFPNYYIFTKYFGTFIHCCTTFKDQFTRVLVNKFTSQCPALLWSWYKKGQAREIQLHISSQSWRPPILGYDGAKKDFDSAVICMTFLESLSNMVAIVSWRSLKEEKIIGVSLFLSLSLSLGCFPSPGWMVAGGCH